MPETASPSLMARRFRGFLPVVIDVETGGFNLRTRCVAGDRGGADRDRPDEMLRRGATHRYHVQPFEGANIEPASLEVIGIDPHHPLRPAIPEKDALQRIFREMRHAVSASGCKRAILVGHNAFFDLSFINAAVARADIKRNPFHPFSCFDTATLAGVAFGQTVLSRAFVAAGLEWDAASAHSAAYDAERTADLFCLICNQFKPIYDRGRASSRRTQYRPEPDRRRPPFRSGARGMIGLSRMRPRPLPAATS